MKKIAFIFIGVALLVSLGINAFLFSKYKTTQANPIGDQSKIFPLLSPRILFNYPNDLLINFLPLRNNLNSLVAPYSSTFGFYFEYLPTGVSIGVNGSTAFSPQSLIKVPIVMAYYHFQERTGLTDDSVVTLKASQIDSRFGHLWEKGVGYQIKMSDVVNLALTQSDNTAANVLADYVPLEDYKTIYEGLDIDFPDKNPDLKLSAKQYSSILKSLYFSSLLTKDDSEEILNLLTQSAFNDKLGAGVPTNIPVAHKIGSLDNSLFQDCGIVYVPRRPYILCMISVSTEDVARIRMSLVSKTILDYVSSVNK